MKERVNNKTKQTIFTDLAVKGKMKKFFSFSHFKYFSGSFRFP